MSPVEQTTILLQKLAQGDHDAAEELAPRIYDQLHALAARHMANESAGHTLQPTALAHEAYLRLIDQDRTDWNDRTHFFAVASKIIRRILVDHARARGAAKRGGNAPRVTLTAALDGEIPGSLDVVELNDLLEELAALNERHAQVVDLRCFGGLTIDEAATALGVSPATVKADWRFARAWLKRQLTS